ncbi:MAG TPA: VOC family protein [Streptosporangiaceae bacterium]
MSSRLLCVTVDCTDPARLADFWSRALDYTAHRQLPNGAHLIAEDERTTPWLAFTPVPEDKQTKNRLHLDIQADARDADARDAEVERLVALGATRTDVGQPGDSAWVVLADPEGNEFCVLPPRPA